MHHHIIEATIETSFKGEHYFYKSTLDLDKIMMEYDELPDLNHIIATLNHIDQYSYLYEIILSEPIQVTNPQGLVAECMDEDGLNMAQFWDKWHENKALLASQNIAKEFSLDLTPQLQAALIKTYQLGLEQRIR